MFIRVTSKKVSKRDGSVFNKCPHAMITHESDNDSIVIRDEDPVMVKKLIRGSVPQTKGDY